MADGIDQLSILNDPNMVPFITHDGRCFITHKEPRRFLIVRSSLRRRFVDSTEGDRDHDWMYRKGLMTEDEYH